MLVYLACTVRGDRTNLEAVRHINRWLTERGHHVLTAHLLADDVETAEAVNTDQEIYRRDVAWVESADLVVAEASGSSYGVGFEVGYTLGRAPLSHQRVCVLYRADRHDAISRLISGLTSEHGCVHAYASLAEIDAILEECVGLSQ
jgi:nucleoside 2-deoxyribosyltransferase